MPRERTMLSFASQQAECHVHREKHLQNGYSATNDISDHYRLLGGNTLDGADRLVVTINRNTRNRTWSH
jgi:hypothetical protein